MRKNIGTYDALMRITCGLTGVAWGTARMVRRPNSSMPLLITMASAMKVAEGITRFCPMLAMLGKESVEDKGSFTSFLKKGPAKALDNAKNMDNTQNMDNTNSRDNGKFMNNNLGSYSIGSAIEEMAQEMSPESTKEPQ